MHERAIAPYPRRHAVIVPALLVRAGCSVTIDPTDPTGSKRAAAATVEWVRATMRRLPAEVLEAPLPDPAVMLRRWPLCARTRGCLARLGTAGRVQSWRVRDLIGAARLGPTTLVDLLAAREENDSVTSARHRDSAIVTHRGLDLASTPIASRLDTFSSALATRLPLEPEELNEMVVRHGLATVRLELDDVVRLFRDWQLPAPFRIVRRAGATVLVAPTTLATAEALVTTACHLVFHWGLCTLSSVVKRIRSLALADLGASAAARVLASIPRFRWLDEASGWFSFVGCDSRVRSAIRKVFSVAPRVSMPDLSLALAKRVKALAQAPRAAIEAYLSQVAEFEVRGEWVTPQMPFIPTPLARTERTIVGILRASGGVLERETLRESAAAAGVKLATVRHFIRTSPLVLARASELHLVGVSSAALQV